jgi:hypothetical protein
MTKAMRITLLLGVAAALVAAASPAMAICSPGILGGTVGSDTCGIVQIDVATPGGNADNTVMLGRFWQPTKFCTNPNTCAQSGGFTSDQWLFPGDAGKVVMQANLGDGSVIGCPGGELIALLQSPATTSRGAVFAVWRVDQLGGFASDFDYSRLSTGGADLLLHTIPPPSVSQTGTKPLLNLTVTLPDPSVVFKGVSAPDGTNSACTGGSDSPLAASGTITGVRLMQAFGLGDAVPSPAKANWTFTGRSLPAGGALPQFALNCTTDVPAGQDVYYAVQLQLDTTNVVLTDFVGDPFRVICNSGLANPKFKHIDKKPKK